MLKILPRTLIAVTLLGSFFLALNVAIVAFAEDDVPLIYLTDYNYMNDFYIVLDIETGDTQRFQRPADFVGIRYNYSDGAPPARQDYTSPYDNAVRFVLLRDFNAQNPEEIEQLYRVRDDQLEPVLSGDYIYLSQHEFTDDGRYVYLFEKSGSDMQYTFYTLYRYDIQSAELSVISANVASAGLNCQENWCQLTLGVPDSEDTLQTLMILHKNSGQLRQVATAGEFDLRFWWRPDELLYTTYDEDGGAVIHTYHIETGQSRILAEIEGQDIANIYGTDWLIVTANSPDNDRIFDVYIVNDLDRDPTTYPLGIQSGNRWLSYASASDGSLLLVAPSPRNDGPSDVYVINDVAAHPTIDRVTGAEFDAMRLHNVRLEFDLGDTSLMRVGVSDNEWRYYTFHVPTRTITPVATFNRRQGVMQTRLSADNRWLAVSIDEAGQYYITLVSMDGSQPQRTWDIGTESYTCLLDWSKPDIAPPPCDLYFGRG